VKYGDVRLGDELQFSVYNFELADVEKAWAHFELYEAECNALIERLGVSKKDLKLKRDNSNDPDAGAGHLHEIARFPILAAYDLCLKCSHLFNILDARGAISVTERVGVITRVRALAVGIAKAWVDQQKSQLQRPESASEQSDEPESVSQRKPKAKKEALSPVV
jgi:glycyl-tRNA synthetase alpha chain